mgnify:FL=1
MQDPYSILGVSRDASDEDIKKAYRKLSRIYHPDANINNPNKDQAEAKFKEIQQAYQQIMKEKEMGASGYTGTGSGGYGDAGSGYGGFGGFGPFGGFYGQYTNQNQQTTETEEDIHLRATANYLNSGHYKEALNVLSGIKDRSARWYYYSSIANSGMGNNVLAWSMPKKHFVWSRPTINISLLSAVLKMVEAGIVHNRQCMAVHQRSTMISA